MLGIPEPTPFDWNFRLLGIPVRVNPFFWAVAAFVGWQTHDGLELLSWVACVFGSILVHEYGHALTMRALAPQRPRIVLHFLGGLAVPEREQRTAGRKILVLLMGPGAGFLLFALVLIFERVVLGIPRFGDAPGHLPPSWYNQHVAQVVWDLLFINGFWGLFNLLPIYPLDGGQIAHVLLNLRDRRQGAAWCHILSMVTAGGAAVYIYSQGQHYNAIFLAYLGLINYQLYQAARYQGAAGGFADEEDDWWRR